MVIAHKQALIRMLFVAYLEFPLLESKAMPKNLLLPLGLLQLLTAQRCLWLSPSLFLFQFLKTKNCWKKCYLISGSQLPTLFYHFLTFI